MLASGSWAKILSIKFKGEGQVYNFTVANNHNYFVDKLGLLTHNKDCATDLDVIQKGTKAWDDAIETLQNGGKSNVGTNSSTDAKDLLLESRGNMNRYQRYSDKPYKKGYEMHPNEIGTQNAPHNDLPHVKWKDWHDKINGRSGHIFFDVPN